MCFNRRRKKYAITAFCDRYLRLFWSPCCVYHDGKQPEYEKQTNCRNIFFVDHIQQEHMDFYANKAPFLDRECDHSQYLSGDIFHFVSILVAVCFYVWLYQAHTMSIFIVHTINRLHASRCRAVLSRHERITEKWWCWRLGWQQRMKLQEQIKKKMVCRTFVIRYEHMKERNGFIFFSFVFHFDVVSYLSVWEKKKIASNWALLHVYMNCSPKHNSRLFSAYASFNKDKNNEVIHLRTSNLLWFIILHCFPRSSISASSGVLYIYFSPSFSPPSESNNFRSKILW